MLKELLRRLAYPVTFAAVVGIVWTLAWCNSVLSAAQATYMPALPVIDRPAAAPLVSALPPGDRGAPAK